MSYTTIVDEFNDIIINNSEDYIIRDILNFIDQDYNFKGFMVKFQAIHGGGITKPLFVIDHRDAYTFNTYCQELSYLIDAAKAAQSYDRSSKWKSILNLSVNIFFFVMFEILLDVLCLLVILITVLL